MRLASALLSGLLLVASTALADPPAAGQGAAPPPPAHPASGAAAAARPRQDAGAAQTPDPSPPRLRRTTYPEYGSGAAPGEPATESMCYVVFGELRCDRRLVDTSSRTPR